MGKRLWDDILDAAKIAVGLSTAISGAIIGCATSWTGVGAVVGGIGIVVGADQMSEGINSILSRANGGPPINYSPIEQGITEASRFITGQENSFLEYSMQETYLALQFYSSCYSCAITVKTTIQSVKLTYIPPHSEFRYVRDNLYIRKELYLKGECWKIDGAKDALCGGVDLFFQGVSTIDHKCSEECNK